MGDARQYGEKIKEWRHIMLRGAHKNKECSRKIRDFLALFSIFALRELAFFHTLSYLFAWVYGSVLLVYRCVLVAVPTVGHSPFLDIA